MVAPNDDVLVVLFASAIPAGDPIYWEDTASGGWMEAHNIGTWTDARIQVMRRRPPPPQPGGGALPPVPPLDIPVPIDVFTDGVPNSVEFVLPDTFPVVSVTVFLTGVAPGGGPPMVFETPIFPLPPPPPPP
jgi:hypothetical protein